MDQQVINDPWDILKRCFQFLLGTPYVTFDVTYKNTLSDAFSNLVFATASEYELEVTANTSMLSFQSNGAKSFADYLHIEGAHLMSCRLHLENNGLYAVSASYKIKDINSVVEKLAPIIRKIYETQFIELFENELNKDNLSK